MNDLNDVECTPPKLTWNLKTLKGKSSSKPSFLGSMLVFTFHEGGVRSGGGSKLKHLFRVSLPVTLVEDCDGSLPLQSLNLSSTNIYHTNNMYNMICI